MNSQGDGWALEVPVWQGDAVARLTDFVRQKTGSALGEWRQLLTRLEDCGSAAQLRATLRAVIARVRRQRASGAAGDVDTEFEQLCVRILEAGQKTSIENYPEYLFTIDCNIEL